jgi:hypothetical protein
MKKHRVPMPGMVPSAANSGSRSPAPALSPKPTVESTSMKKTGSASGTLPLPGMESPKLPLPGQEPTLSPVDHDSDVKHDNQRDIQDEQTMSKLSGSGYKTLHSTDTVQPSESNALSEEVNSRPSARAISHEFEKPHNNELYQGQGSWNSSKGKATSPYREEEGSQSSPNDDNAWAAIGSAMLSPSSGEDTVKKPSTSNHRHVPSWEGTLKTLGKGPARHAPRPPSSQGKHSVSNTSSDPIVVQRRGMSKLWSTCSRLCQAC